MSCNHCWPGNCNGACACEEKQPDTVHQPAHYTRWAMQPIEFIAVNDLPFWLANIIKYICRYDAKDGLQDLLKARAYLDMKIRHLEGYPCWWVTPETDEFGAVQS